ncbi:sensor domain-containing diguanylate cyclase [Arhodomonas sp. SL1]|uniref:sensor domain-containing diguanylate cyclase n=1 Tax=Arhodomonas sp. SL1 TaxID=3425691 RepID=UPI003F8851C9
MHEGIRPWERTGVRLAASLLLLSAVFVAAIGYSAYSQKRAEAVETLRKEALNLSRVMNYAAETTASLNALERFVLTVAANHQVRAVALVDGARNQVVASSRHAWRERPVAELRDTIVGPWLTRPLDDDSLTHWLPEARQAVAISRLWLTNPTTAVGQSLAGGRVVVVMDGSQPLAQASTSAAMQAAWTALGAAVFMAMAYLMVRTQFLTPLRRVYRALRAQHAGHTEQRAPEVGGAEMRLLARRANDFFDLHRRLERYRRRLEVYRRVFNDLPVAVFRARLHGETAELEANPAFRTSLGTRALGRTSRRALETLFADADERDRFMQALRDDGEVRAREVEMRTATGEEPRWIALTARLTRDDDTEVIDGIAEDITERKRALAALQAERTRLRDIANTIPGAVFEYRRMPDGSESLPYVSDGVARLFDLRADESPNDPATLTARIPADDLTALQSATRAANRPDNGEWHVEFRVETAQGVRWVLGHAVAASDPQPGRLFRGVLMDISRRKALEEQLKRAATHDALTGALNRAGFVPILEHAIEQARRYGHPLSLLLADIDHFKRINDHHGHELGDRVLERFAVVIRERLRASDLLVRWGGEEFIILLPQTDAGCARVVAEELRRNVATAEFPVAEHVTMSVGVADLREEDNVKSLIRRADAGTYNAKREGRNRVASADSADLPGHGLG